MTILGDLQRALSDLAEARMLLVAVDFDGTLAPIVPTPMDARAVPGSIESLCALAAAPQTAAVIISGRSRQDLRTLTGAPTGVDLVGSHGMEFATGFAVALTAVQQQLLELLSTTSTALTDRFPGMSVECKPASVAVHLRNVAPTLRDHATQTVNQELVALSGVQVTRGKFVIELAVIDTDKGSAIDLLRARVGAEAVLFIGDDTTDEKAFARLSDHDVGLKVGPGITQAQLRVGDPHEVAALLSELARLRVHR
ncbi:MAG: trehalose-phosphatase [Antricoccus sp.]